ncbi:MAG: ABC transporter permease [Firmicutes bacterium]|nr:ABC transporter permease [Bacillota bacterium]
MKNFKLLTIPYFIWLSLFSIIPLGFAMFYGFTTPDIKFTLSNFLGIEKYASVFLRSIFLSGMSTFICFIVGYPAALFISKLERKWQKIIIAGIVLQMWISFILTTYSLMTILESDGILSKIVQFFGGKRTSFLNTRRAVMLGFVYNSLPFMILPIYSSLSKLDPNVLDAAKDLGAGKFDIFKKIIFPLSMPGVLSGFLMVFAPNVGNFIISKMLGGSENILIGELIELKFLGSTYNPRSGSAIALVLMFFVMLCTSTMNNWVYLKTNHDI